jgi:tetratricopeptide (TPR) repeat protein
VNDRHRVAHLSEIDEIEPRDPTKPSWRTVRRFFDIQAFGVNAWTAENPGDPAIEEHDEVGASAGRHEELYYVASGRATFTVDGEIHDARAGTFVFVREPEVRRGATAEEPNTVVLAFGGKPGEPFSISLWEELTPAVEKIEQQDYAGAKELLQRALDQRPDAAGALYNLACAESLLGERDAAVGHLVRAIELDRGFLDYARGDSDFDAIRGDPRFASAVGQVPA